MGTRRLAAIAAVVTVVLIGQQPSRAASGSLSIAIVGNHFVDGAGQTVRLLGVNTPSAEYTCVQGNGYDDGQFTDADAAAIASWHVTAVRIPLNEDCWLGINGQPTSSADNPGLTAAGYQQEIESWVQALNAHGLYAILDLHWSAPGSQVADSQQPMPDAHSTNFWQSVAQTFKSNPAVVFDLFNEPFDPTDPRSGSDTNPAHAVSWQCWDTGGCVTQSYEAQGSELGATYPVVGFQTLLTAVRNTGATQPVMIGGLNYANDLSQWATHAPVDPLNQEAASFHNYMGQACDTQACWDSTIAPIAAEVPVVTGEFDEDDYDEAHCADTTPSTFDQDYMSWADAHGVSYLAWGWWVLSQQEQDANACGAYYLLDGYDGTPAAPNGTALHDHLAALAAAGVSTTSTSTTTTTTTPPPTTTTVTTPTTTTSTGGGGSTTSRHPVKLSSLTARVRSGGSAVAFTLRAAHTCTGTLTGRTAASFAVPAVTQHRHRVALGTVHFTLSAGKPRSVVLRLSRPVRTLLAHRRTLKITVTVTLGTGATRSVTHRGLTLRTG